MDVEENEKIQSVTLFTPSETEESSDIKINESSLEDNNADQGPASNPEDLE